MRVVSNTSCSKQVVQVAVSRGPGDLHSLSRNIKQGTDALSKTLTTKAYVVDAPCSKIHASQGVVTSRLPLIACV